MGMRPTIRPAVLGDLAELVRLEDLSFETDRLNRSRFRHFLTKGNDILLVAEWDDGLTGYALVLFHTGTSLARLYSFAVDPAARGAGIGIELLAAAEAGALDRDCPIMRLETRKDNTPAQALFSKAGYKSFGTYADYYDDHMDAIRMEKILAPHLAPDLARVPYYAQTLKFTCGPASIMMAMRGLDDGFAMNRENELQLWRESTTIFMQGGHGGCGPYGLARAASERGFDAEILVNNEDALFIDSVQAKWKKEVIRLLQSSDIASLEDAGVPIRHQEVRSGDLIERFATGGIPLVLISSYRMDRKRVPHWVVMTGHDDRFIYIHDPFVTAESEESATDCMGMPILQKEFDAMARYGKARFQAAVVLYRQGERP